MTAAETIEALRARARTSLFPMGGVAITMAHGDEALRPLAEKESIAMETALPKRRGDFRLGRHCAHLALAELGMRADSIPIGPDRAPVWPDGIRGALSHSHGIGIAVAASGHRYSGIGIDIEKVQDGFGRSNWSSVFTEAEIEDLKGLPPHAGLLRAHIWFSVKESVLKAIYGATGSTCTLKSIRLDRRGDWIFSASETSLDIDCGVSMAAGKNFVISGAWIMRREATGARYRRGLQHVG